MIGPINNFRGQFLWSGLKKKCIKKIDESIKTIKAV